MSLQFFSFRFAIYCLTHFQTGSLLPLSFILSLFPFISWPPFSSFDLPHHALLPVSVNTSFALLVFFPSLLFQSVSLVFFSKPSPFLVSSFTFITSPFFPLLSSLLFLFSSTSLFSPFFYSTVLSNFSFFSCFLTSLFLLYSQSFLLPPSPPSLFLSLLCYLFFPFFNVHFLLSFSPVLSLIPLFVSSGLCFVLAVFFPFSLPSLPISHFLFPSLLSPSFSSCPHLDISNISQGEDK